MCETLQTLLQPGELLVMTMAMKRVESETERHKTTSFDRQHIAPVSKNDDEY